MQVDIIYTASLDGTAKTLTIVSILFSIIGVFVCVRALRIAGKDLLTKIIYSSVLIILIGVFLVSYLYHPSKYILGNFDIAISRPIGDITIHVPDILEIRAIKETELEGTTRVFGDGGLFGYFGHYHSPNLGDMQWYATNKNNLVIIRTKQGDAFVISPDNKDFIGWILAKKADL
jgi:hypothetical protein